MPEEILTFQDIRLQLFACVFHLLPFWPEVCARTVKCLTLNEAEWHDVGSVLSIALPGSQIPEQCAVTYPRMNYIKVRRRWGRR